ncbi:MAG: hypothetical protein ABL933_06420 [Methyloglobulus sp.]|nr:hypothetical protein [Methyloglobulus sp.]
MRKVFPIIILAAFLICIADLASAANRLLTNQQTNSGIAKASIRIQLDDASLFKEMAILNI